MAADRIIEARSFVTDVCSQEDISHFDCTIGRRSLSQGFSVANPTNKSDGYGNAKSLVPVKIREDYASQFVEWSFDDTVEYVSVELWYRSIELEVQFIDGETRTWRYDVDIDDDDDDLILESPVAVDVMPATHT
jgi:hypothetical protein